MRKLKHYSLSVENIGCFFVGNNKVKAIKDFHDYVFISKEIRTSRGYRSEVVLMEDGEPIRNYYPKDKIS